LVLVREGVGFFLKVLEFILLDESLLFKPIVLGLDVSFDLRDVLLGIRLSLSFEVLEFLGKVVFDTLLLSFHLRLAIAFQGIKFHFEHLIPVFFIFQRFDTHLLGIFELV
jgi:hypothetical protein